MENTVVSKREFLENIVQAVTGDPLDIVRSRIAMCTEYSRRKFNDFAASGGSENDFYRETDAYVHELVNWEEDPYKKSIAKFCAQHYKPETPLLDFGCVIGTVLQNFYDAGFSRLDGVEINRYNRRFVKERFKTSPPGTTGVFETLDQTTPPYGIMVCLHVLEHVDDPLETMKKMYGMMMKGGLFLGVAPFDQVGEDFPEHRMAYKDLKLQDICVKAGLTVQDVIPFGNFKNCQFYLVVALKK